MIRLRASTSDTAELFDYDSAEAGVNDKNIPVEGEE